MKGALLVGGYPLLKLLLDHHGGSPLSRAQLSADMDSSIVEISGTLAQLKERGWISIARSTSSHEPRVIVHAINERGKQLTLALAEYDRLLDLHSKGFRLRTAPAFYAQTLKLLSVAPAGTLAGTTMAEEVGRE